MENAKGEEFFGLIVQSGAMAVKIYCLFTASNETVVVFFH